MFFYLSWAIILLMHTFYKHLQVVVVDAETFSELARMQFTAEGAVAQGFHGIFVPENADILARY